LIGRTGAVGLDEKNSKVALIAVRPRELVLEDGAHEAVVEQPGRAIDDVERFRLRIIDLDPARRTEDCALWQGGPASQARLGFRPPAQEIANRHRDKAYQPSGGGLGREKSLGRSMPAGRPLRRIAPPPRKRGGYG